MRGNKRFVFVIQSMTHVTANRNREFHIHLVPMHGPLTRTGNGARRETGHGESVAMEKPRDQSGAAQLDSYSRIVYENVSTLFFPQLFQGGRMFTRTNHELSVGNYSFSLPSSQAEAKWLICYGGRNRFGNIWSAR